MFDLETLFDTVDALEAFEGEGEALDHHAAAALLGLPVAALDQDA